MFANKNKKTQDDPEAGMGNTITKMFKNAPPPRVKPKRTVDDISGAEDSMPKHESSKKVKTSNETIRSLDRFKFGQSKTVDQSLEEIKNTQFGISNTDAAAKVNKSKGLVQQMKDCLEKDRIQ